MYSFATPTNSNINFINHSNTSNLYADTQKKNSNSSINQNYFSLLVDKEGKERNTLTMAVVKKNMK